MNILRLNLNLAVLIVTRRLTYRVRHNRSLSYWKALKENESFEKLLLQALWFRRGFGINRTPFVYVSCLKRRHDKRMHVLRNYFCKHCGFEEELESIEHLMYMCQALSQKRQVTLENRGRMEAYMSKQRQHQSYF